MRSLKPFLSRVVLARELDDDDDGEELAWDEEKHEFFCSIEANSFKTGTKHLNDRLCLPVRSEQRATLSVSWYASYTLVAFFLMIFTTRVNSFIGTTIVVPDNTHRCTAIGI